MALRGLQKITLVIEQEVVRLMEVRKGRVARWGSAPLPPNTLQRSAVANPEALIEVVERLWRSQSQERPLSRNNIVLGILGHHIPTRIVSVQNLDTSDAQIMAQKARETLPEPDLHHVWQLVGGSTQPGLFVMGAPIALINSYLEPLKRIGLGLAAMDVKPLALIRAVGQRNTVIIDAERTMGSIIIVDDTLPRRAAFPGLNAPLLASPEEKIMRLAEVLYETVQRYNRSTTSKTLHPAVPIFLTGSLANHSLLQEIVQDVLGHSVGSYTPPIEVPPDMPISQFMVNIGLAQKRLK
ncbi:MAG: type IV pilus biogenesis protein PilM [Ardenticatenaceae bacterium]